MTTTLHLDVRDQLIDGARHRITRLARDEGRVVAEIFHTFDGMTPLRDDSSLDGHVLCLLLAGMKIGGTLHVHGQMSPTMLRNLNELQLIWHRWRPELYQRLEIVPDRIGTTMRKSTEKRAIAAFSGGADSTFTALRHTQVLAPHLRYPLTDVLMVHGFDVELRYPHYFDRLTQRVEPLLNELGLRLRTIRTNSKDWERQNWQDSHGMELAACLHMLAEDFDYALIGSCEPYDSMCTPWGSGPVTDHLMGNGTLQVIHDGAGYSRTEKIDVIGRFPTACKTLKVCWAGADQSDNCGHCEKCTRTMMNFLACGYDIPPCFPEGLKPSDVLAMKIYNGPQMNALRNIVAYARSNGVAGAWIKWAEKRTRQGYSSYSPGPVRRAVSRALELIGLKEPIKRLLVWLHYDHLIWH